MNYTLEDNKIINLEKYRLQTQLTREDYQLLKKYAKEQLDTYKRCLQALECSDSKIIPDIEKDVLEAKKVIEKLDYKIMEG